MSTRNLRVVENTPDVGTSDICAEKESLLTAFLKSSTRIFHVPSATVDMNLSKMPPKEVLVNLITFGSASLILFSNSAGHLRLISPFWYVSLLFPYSTDGLPLEKEGFFSIDHATFGSPPFHTKQYDTS
jgi:hypothetical protein